MVKGYKQVTPREGELMRKWRKAGQSLTDVMGLTGRSKQTVINHTFEKKKKGAGSGRPIAITEKIFKKMHASLIKLQKKANAETEISIAAVKLAAGVTASDKTCLKYFHKEGIWFRPLRQKPILTEADVAERVDFTDTNCTRPKEKWIYMPHATIDNKNFPIYTNNADYNEAARRTLRGGYRARTSQPQNYLVKRKKAQKYPAKGVQVTAAVVKGKIRMFEFVDGNWNGQKAADMYKGPLLRTLRRAFPERAAQKNAKWIVLEDNDPAGYKSSAGKRAKAEAKITSMDLPPRSPDLNVLDYSLWSAINRAMRKQERAFRKNFKETKAEYLKRLKKTALGLPKAEVSKAVMDIHRRIRAIKAADGGLIVE